jgi:hypothetical protein
MLPVSDVAAGHGSSPRFASARPAATVYYSQLVSSVAEYLGVLSEEAEAVEICREEIRIGVS